MKKQIFLLLACLVGSVQAFASGCDSECNPCSIPSDCCLDFDSKLTVAVGGGLRWDTISWKTIGSSFESSSDSFSQKWRDIKLGVIEVDVSFLACEHYLLKLYGDYGWIYGKNRLSTNFNDFENVSCSSSGFSSNSRKGHAYDLSAAIGYQFSWDCYQLSFAPLVGYSYDYLQVNRASFPVPYGEKREKSCSSDDSKNHNFRLSGPWLGFAAAYQATCEMSFYIDYAFHWANFRARVDEGLFFDGIWSAEPTNRLRSKNAYGNEVTVGGIYNLCDCWFAGLRFNYKNWWSSKKHRSCHVYENTDCGSCHASSSSDDSSNFRHLDWNTYTLTLDVGYTF